MDDRIQILDCTLRDGGLGLEDAAKNTLSSKVFDTVDMDKIINHLNESRIDIVELGSIEITQEDKRGYAIYQDIESISRKIPQKQYGNQMYAALFRGPDTPLEDIPSWNPSYCEAVRVIIRYSELQKSLEFCAGLSQKGYKVFVQPMLTMRYTEKEIQMLIDASNEMKAYALYFVDSYGYMQAKDIIRFFGRYDSELDSSIRIGFHAHNNMDLAFSNALIFMNRHSSRKLIIDSCVLGMGQGAGNLQTELIVGYMNSCCKTPYHYDSILNACEIIEKYWGQSLWGYSVTRLLPAIHKSAYKYALALRNQYCLSFSEINNILSDIPEELRNRYTPENTTELLKLHGYERK